VLLGIAIGAYAIRDFWLREPVQPELDVCKPGLAAGTLCRDTRADGQPCPECPEMVVVPAGSFMMGSADSETDRDLDEGPRHPVTIPAELAIGRYEVTFEEWDACVEAGRCWNVDAPWGRGRQPVVNVRWDDAKTYTNWLSQVTGKPYRLPSEAEWEFAARGNRDTPFWTGPTISTAQANYDGNVYREKTVAVDDSSFPPNPFGLYHVHGNVWEWVEDCYHDSYTGAPQDGSAWTSGCTGLPRRVLRGGSWISKPWNLRSAVRYLDAPEVRYDVIGLRVARMLTP
jgi:formylglycine-generating enzyme required for sulfatase activity